MVWYKDTLGKPRWYTVGWHSDGIRPAYANEVRKKLTDKSKPPPLEIALTTPSLTVGKAVADYFKWAEAEEKHIAPERNRYSKHLQHRLDAIPLESITLQMLCDLKSALRNTMSPQSVRHCFGLLRRAVNHALELETWHGANPFAVKRHSAFTLPRPNNEATRYLTKEEARALLAALRPRSQQLHDMALLSLKTGLRATEIFGIRGQDLDAAGLTIHITAKGGEPQTVPAPADIMQILTGYRRTPHEFVFQADQGGPIQWGISTTFSRVVQQLGLNDGITDDRRRVRFHTLRHTFASWLAQSGKVTLQQLMEMMRHRDIEMTLRYAHLIPGGHRHNLRIIDDALGDFDHDD
ncbi:tyrosine-type recombinase/integrase [Desulfovibrio inopinatus]|uniref:tyrosine-type recombinase/integrase n=1 Tax=Desulfovibrio inopinatus TaxID=102109 RepID=UPI0012ECACB3|nr:site-specific integrase [Desulfovibrio inopinatus]